ncbi:MAG TPA: NUDIX domain-containing protein [Candidatus Paceibacterota bacterium]|jgi:8-oxo-dGTP diphosphatase|nr:NUDIX domain-containing protein [Candidatus Paceibacterota bacterium]
MKEDAQFYIGQKAFIRRGDEILILGDPHEGLDYPGGKIQEGEIDLAESLKREVREETGLEIEVGTPFATWTNTFPPHHRLAGKRVYLVGYRCNYVSGDVKLSDEHDKFRWVNKENYKEADDGTSYFEILDKYFEE